VPRQFTPVKPIPLAEQRGQSYPRLVELMRRLLEPEQGCPWDQKQTFASLRGYVLEEAAEVAGAPNLDGASVEQMVKAWSLVQQTAEVTQDELKQVIAAEAGIPLARLDQVDARAEMLLPAEVAHRRNVLPVDCSDREVLIATSNPLSQEAKRELARLTGRTVRFQLAAPDELHEEIIEVYGPAGPEPESIAPYVDTSPPTGPHVLVVDDEAGQRELFRSILEEEDYRVSVAKDGAEALAMLRGDSSLDLVTLDYWMDKMNGLRVLQQIRSDATLRDIPVIVLTGADDRQIEMSLFEAGADDYIAKPVDKPLFLLRIQAVLRRRTFRR